MSVQTVEEMLSRVESTINRGAAAGFALAGLKLLVMLLAIIYRLDGRLESLGDLSNIVDVLIFAGLSIGVLYQSRTSAVILLLYFVPSELFLYRQTGLWQHLPLSAVFVYFFARAVRASFACHRLRRQQDPAYRPVRGLTYLWWIPGGVVAVVVLGLMAISLVTPSKSLLTGDELPPQDLALLQSAKIVEPDEEIVLFYSAGLFSIYEQGSLITDRRLVSYENDGERSALFAAHLDEIAAVSVTVHGDVLSNSLLRVDLFSGEKVYLFMPARDGDDRRFIAELEKRMN